MLLKKGIKRERREMFHKFDSSYYWDEKEDWMGDACSKQNANAR
jgi:hypothetical protein